MLKLEIFIGYYRNKTSTCVVLRIKAACLYKKEWTVLCHKSTFLDDDECEISQTCVLLLVYFTAGFSIFYLSPSFLFRSLSLSSFFPWKLKDTCTSLFKCNSVTGTNRFFYFTPRLEIVGSCWFGQVTRIFPLFATLPRMPDCIARSRGNHTCMCN